MNAKPMLVVGYVRVSTENQLENYSIEEQTARLNAYCSAKGWTLLHTYIDGGYSGGNTDRPALQQMLKGIPQNKIDAVVVYKLDRLSRSQKDTLSLIEDSLLPYGCDFVSINENFDTSTPFGRAMIGILSVFAQLEKDQITERFTMGRIGRGKAGFFHGGGNAPTGYDYTNGLLQINEYEAIQVRQAFDWFLQGKSINAIEKLLNHTYTTKWTATKVRNVLQNSIYIGKVHFMGQEYPGTHPPIVEESTFLQAKRILHSFERASNFTSAQRSPFRAGYLLSGLLFCARCGARYSANHGYYKCYSRAKSSPRFVIDPNCKNDNWLIADLDAIILQKIDELLSSPHTLEKILQNADKGKTVNLDTEKLKKRVAAIETQMNKLIDLYQVSAIPMETLTHRINDLASEKAALLEELNAPVEIPLQELFLTSLEEYKAGFAACDTDGKRAMVTSIIEKILIDGQRITVHWRV